MQADPWGSLAIQPRQLSSTPFEKPFVSKTQWTGPEEHLRP